MRPVDLGSIGVNVTNIYEHINSYAAFSFAPADDIPITYRPILEDLIPALVDCYSDQQLWSYGEAGSLLYTAKDSIMRLLGKEPIEFGGAFMRQRKTGFKLEPEFPSVPYLKLNNGVLFPLKNAYKEVDTTLKPSKKKTDILAKINIIISTLNILLRNWPSVLTEPPK
jgi:hypothetical protein